MPFGKRPPAVRQASIELNGSKFLVRSYQLLCGGWQIPLFDIFTTDAKAGAKAVSRTTTEIFNTALTKTFCSSRMQTGVSWFWQADVDRVFS